MIANRRNNLHMRIPKGAKYFTMACLFLTQARKICEDYLSPQVNANGKQYVLVCSKNGYILTSSVVNFYQVLCGFETPPEM